MGRMLHLDSSSIDVVGRPVQEASAIATEAVGQPQKTDPRIANLARATARIGDVTQLITTIAEQTLLVL